jgi:DNA-binding PucR family transcriptional regulator
LNKSPAQELWDRVPPEVATALRPALPGVVDQVIAAVQEAVPVYSGGLDPTVRTGVHVALDGFLELVEGGEPGLPERDVYVRFGRAERRNGRSLDALLAAYRAGARQAWRALAAAGEEADVDPHAMYTLAEAIFAFIDDISSASAEGHAFEDSLVARELAERRRRLLEALMAESPVAPEELARLAADAEWTLPEQAAVLAFDAPAARMPTDAVVAELGGRSLAVVPDAATRRVELRRALRGGRGGLGPTVPPAGLSGSASRAALALEMAGEGEVVAASERLLDLVLRADLGLSADLASSALAPLDALPEGQRERLLETLAAWLDAHGEARPAAEALHVHVQTVRYRLDKLRDVFGDALDDPERRLELALALRIRRGAAESR